MQILVSGLFSTSESYGKSDAVLEIILMLLVAFILGYLLRYLIGKSKVSQKNDNCDEWAHKYDLLLNQSELKQNDINKLQAALDECKKNRDALKLAAEKKKPTKKDDLKVVEGIGPKIEQLLFEAEIYTWDDLSKTDVSFIQTILDKAGPNFKVHNPESWPFQAKLATENRWEELNKWQDEHKGGRF